MVLKTERVKVEMWMPSECKEWYRLQAKRRGIPMSVFMVQVLNEFIERRLSPDNPARAFDEMIGAVNENA